MSALTGSIGDFIRFSEAMLVLAEHAPKRMTMAQAIFFVLAASGDIAGKRPTFSDVRDMVGAQLDRSLHTTYRILMEPSKAFPAGLGWLTSELNPSDNREKFLKLTSKGRIVMETLSLSLGRND